MHLNFQELGKVRFGELTEFVEESSLVFVVSPKSKGYAAGIHLVACLSSISS